MGKGCLREDHPLLLGQTGFWGLPIANDKCRTADLIVAVGTRLAEANSSSWDPRFTFSVPPTRLIHIDADEAEIGRNYPTDLGVVADAKLALGALAAAARGKGHRDRAAVPLVGDGGFSTTPSVVATAMEANLPVVWLVMDNAGFGTIAGLESMHYGWGFGCMFWRGGKPYKADYAALARACGARGVMIESAADLGPALREALDSDLPTVIQAPMENAPTPTPGHWNINDIYRKGE